MVFFLPESKRSPEVLHSLYIFLWGNDCFLICHSYHPQRSKANFQVRKSFFFFFLLDQWGVIGKVSLKIIVKIYLCDSCVHGSLNMYEMERCWNPSSPPEPKWDLGWAVLVKSHFVKEMCRVFLFQATYSLRLNTCLYIGKLGHVPLGFTKNKGRQKVNFVKGHGSATVGLWVLGLSWEFV